MIQFEKSYVYARNVVRNKIEAPIYVRKQCSDWIEIANGKSETWFVDEHKVNKINSLLKLMIMPKGVAAGQTIYDTFVGFQMLCLHAVLATVYRNNPNKRKYEKFLLEIARKNGKTELIAVIFIILMLTEPKFSYFYSVAPNGALSREVKKAIREILVSSPDLKHLKYWKIKRDQVDCKITESYYIPLNYSNSTLDGKLPNAFLVDETGALPNSYAIEAMSSGQLTIDNKLGCIISTKYPKIDNPFEDEVSYCKRVLDRIEADDTVFALLYEPDNKKEWMTDDTILKHANPLALCIHEIWEDLLKKRKVAISIKSKRQNFLTKHCNIIYQGIDTESYVDINDVLACAVDFIDWRNRTVYLGIDLAMTNDNCSVTIGAYDRENDLLLFESFAFIPEDRIVEKTENERVDYQLLIDNGECFACGDATVSYEYIEEFIMNIEKNTGCKIAFFGYDRYNCISTAEKLESGGLSGVQIKQHSSVLHAPTKLLSEYISNRKVRFKSNKLYQINFQNARCMYDTNMNRFVNKKKSNGKVDMVVSTIDSTYLIQQNEILNANWGSMSA